MSCKYNFCIKDAKLVCTILVSCVKSKCTGSTTLTHSFNIQCHPSPAHLYSTTSLYVLCNTGNFTQREDHPFWRCETFSLHIVNLANKYRWISRQLCDRRHRPHVLCPLLASNLDSRTNLRVLRKRYYNWIYFVKSRDIWMFHTWRMTLGLLHPQHAFVPAPPQIQRDMFVHMQPEGNRNRLFKHWVYRTLWPRKEVHF